MGEVDSVSSTPCEIRYYTSLHSRNQTENEGSGARILCLENSSDTAVRMARQSSDSPCPTIRRVIERHLTESASLKGVPEIGSIFPPSPFFQIEGKS